MTEKTLTTENIKPALDALRGELAPWPVVAKKQDRLNTAQLNAANSGITSSLVAQIIANTAAIRALESAITGTGLRALVVSSLPAIGTQGILYIVPVTTYDPATDADVVNYSNEYIWIVAPDAPVTEGYYEQVGQTGIVINNGQLTITVNGTSVGTFTANQSGDTTAAITVPTNADYVDKTTAQTAAGVKTFSDGIVSNVTGNVTGNLTGTASKAIADEDGTSIKTGYVNIAGNQTVTGQKTWTGNNTYNGMMVLQASSNVVEQFRQKLPKDVSTSTDALARFSTLVDSAGHNVVVTTEGHWETYVSKSVSLKYKNDVTKAGTVDFRLGSNGKGILYPQSPFECSLGNSTNQWSSVYAQTYYYNGTAWGLDKSNVWTALNSYNQSIQITANFDIGAVPSSEVSGGFNFGNGTSNIGNITSRVSSTGATYSRLYVGNKFANGALDPNGSWKYAELQVGLRANGDRFIYTDAPWRNNLIPYDSNLNLGTTTNKWKTLNGINPGALSLPDASNAVSIDTTNVSMDGTYTYLSVSVNGWLYIALKDTTIKTDGELTFYIGDSGTSSAYVKWAVNFVCSTDGYVRCFIPVLANSRIRVRVNPNGGSPTGLTMTIYPCLGNV